MKAVLFISQCFLFTLLCLNILGTKEPEPAGRDRRMTLAKHPAEVRGSWGGEGDRRAWPPWRGDEAIQRWRGGNRGGTKDKKRRKGHCVGGREM